MGMTRVIIFIALTVYLSAASIILAKMETQYNVQLLNDKGYKVTNTDLEINLAILFSTAKEYIWINLYAIWIEGAIWTLLLVSFFLPTTNAGA